MQLLREIRTKAAGFNLGVVVNGELCTLLRRQSCPWVWTWFLPFELVVGLGVAVLVCRVQVVVLNLVEGN